jgi:hypothetical protein
VEMAEIILSREFASEHRQCGSVRRRLAILADFLPHSLVKSLRILGMCKKLLTLHRYRCIGSNDFKENHHEDFQGSAPE